ncbi:hypothetical protein B0O79_0092 [Flavobacteriaceae bacterium MAR_2009_75]|nr:hypothetical protein B0O79_0092 [Flavobacteriaceae bacterium MAR_2009_75]
MDNLEKHIRDNQEVFNDHRADRAKMWAEIESRLDKEKTKVIPLWKKPIFKVAATVAVLLGLSTLIGINFFDNTTDTKDGFVSQELQDIDMHYRSLVSYQVKLVEQNDKLSENDKQEFLSFMNELDKEYEELRLEMRNNLDNQLVLEAIVSNYKKRIELIENLLHHLKEPQIKDENYGYTL